MQQWRWFRGLAALCNCSVSRMQWIKLSSQCKHLSLIYYREGKEGKRSSPRRKTQMANGEWRMQNAESRIQNPKPKPKPNTDRVNSINEPERSDRPRVVNTHYIAIYLSNLTCHFHPIPIFVIVTCYANLNIPYHPRSTEWLITANLAFLPRQHIIRNLISLVYAHLFTP